MIAKYIKKLFLNKKSIFFLNTIEIQFQMVSNSSLARHGAGLFSSYPDTEPVYSHVIPTRS